MHFRRRRFRTGLGRLAVAVAAFGIFVLATAGLAFATVPFKVADYATPGGDPWGTSFDLSGNLWVAMPGCDLPDVSNPCAQSTLPGKLALFNPNTHQFTTVVTLGIDSRPLFVAVAPDGRVWFTLPLSNSVGVYDPSNGSVAEWAVPTGSAEPWDLAVDPRGKVWLTENLASKIATFDPATRIFSEFATPTPDSMPYGITVDPNGPVWFTENNDSVAQIGEFTPDRGIVEYKIRNTPTIGLTPHLITEDQHGNPWWSEGFVGAVGTLNVQQAQPGTNNGVRENIYSTCGAFCGFHTSGISYHNGRIWFDDSVMNSNGGPSGHGAFGWIPEGGGPFTFYNPPGAHPHDGLNVDPSGRVYFDEEFSDALAETTATNGSFKG